MYNSLLNKTIGICFFLMCLMDGYCQFFADSATLKREASYEFTRKRSMNFLEGLADTLILKGKKYFFRSSPLFLKSGYSNVLPLWGDYTIIGWTPMCDKKYRLTWVVKNDSLFISKIKPFYYFWNMLDKSGNLEKDKSKWTPEDGFIPNDTIVSRFEAFTGNIFKNELLFVDWISGEFGILKINPNPPPKNPSYPSWFIKRSDGSIEGEKEEDQDVIGHPMLIHIKNGVVVKIKKDKRKKKY